MEVLHFRLVGDSPLLMHSSRLANPLDPVVKEIKKITKKGKKKTDEDLASIFWLEFIGGMYFDEETGPFIPGLNIEGSIRDGAKATKQGKDVQRALAVVEDKIKLVYKGPRKQKELFDGGFVDVRSVRINASTTMRCRPYFREWSTDPFTVSFDPEKIDAASVPQFLEQAGRYIGICDGKPRYGKYHAEVVKNGK